MIVSAEKADWSREKPRQYWDPSRKLIKTIRDYQANSKNSLLNRFFKKVTILRYRFWSTVTGADIPLNTLLGGGILIPHPNGIVIHRKTKIGPNCLIHQQVTIGVKANQNEAPVIGGHVDIGAGAKIIGNIKIGDHAVIGANAVVTKDVPAFAIAAGIPAKIIGSNAEEAEND